MVTLVVNGENVRQTKRWKDIWSRESAVDKQGDPWGPGVDTPILQDISINTLNAKQRIKKKKLIQIYLP